MFRRLTAAALAGGALALIGVQSLAHGVDYDAKASARAAQNWAAQASALAPAVSDGAAESPEGTTVIASRLVPDTPADRARFGEPMSRAGKATAPIGD